MWHDPAADQLPPQHPKPYHAQISLCMALDQGWFDAVRVGDVFGVTYSPGFPSLNAVTREVTRAPLGFVVVHVRAGLIVGPVFETQYEALSLANRLSTDGGGFDWRSLKRRRDNVPLGDVRAASNAFRKVFEAWLGT
jgi:hypothetical protein